MGRDRFPDEAVNPVVSGAPNVVWHVPDVAPLPLCRSAANVVTQFQPQAPERGLEPFGILRDALAGFPPLFPHHGQVGYRRIGSRDRVRVVSTLSSVSAGSSTAAAFAFGAALARRFGRARFAARPFSSASRSTFSNASWSCFAVRSLASSMSSSPSEWTPSSDGPPGSQPRGLPSLSNVAAWPAIGSTGPAVTELRAHEMVPSETAFASSSSGRGRLYPAPAPYAGAFRVCALKLGSLCPFRCLVLAELGVVFLWPFPRLRLARPPWPVSRVLRPWPCLRRPDPIGRACLARDLSRHIASTPSQVARLALART